MSKHRPPEEWHGTQNGYNNLGCRCRPCTDAWASAHNEYMQRPEAAKAHRMRTRLSRGKTLAEAEEMERKYEAATR